MDISEILALAGQRERKPMNFPLPLAQAMELRDRFARAHSGPLPSPGDLVRFKPGLGNLKDEVKNGLIFVFWRYLDADDWADRQIIETRIGNGNSTRLDCMLGHIRDGELLFVPNEAAFLEIITEDDLK